MGEVAAARGNFSPPGRSGSHPAAPQEPVPAEGPVLPHELAKELTERLGTPVSAQAARVLTSGASRRSWRVELVTRSGAPRAVVVQATFGRALRAGGSYLAMTTQAVLMERARAEGLPVPPVVCAGERAGWEYLVSEWLEGEALPPRLLRDPRWRPGLSRLADDCALALATLPQVAVADLGLDGSDRLELYRRALDESAHERPVLELAYRWLCAHRPPPSSPGLVHGDFRLGNLLVGDLGLVGLLDWELAHLGDWHEDLAWASLSAWSFERHRPPGVFPEVGPWLEACRRAGLELDQARFEWWRVAGTWTWAVICLLQARRHLEGPEPSLEHAVIGRRVSESEWDLLELIDELDPR